MEDLDRVLERLKDSGIKINAKKCRLARKEIHFLGHVISEKGIHCDPAKVKAITDMKWPTKLKQL